MSKAILVLNKKPQHCGVCPLKIYNYNLKDNSAIVFCYVEPIPQYCEHTNIYDYWFHAKKPKWCPLKLLPKKRKLPADMVDYTNYGEEPWFTDGYNACIDEMLGEEE